MLWQPHVLVGLNDSVWNTDLPVDLPMARIHPLLWSGWPCYVSDDSFSIQTSSMAWPKLVRSFRSGVVGFELSNVPWRWNFIFAVPLILYSSALELFFPSIMQLRFGPTLATRSW